VKKIIIVIVVFIVGYFGFQYFFNKEKTKAEEAKGQLVEEKDKDWVSLFDGKTFKGWHNYKSDSISSQWQIVDSAMVFTPHPDKPSGINNLVTDKEYTNFKLSIDWKISEAGNSGIFWGVFEGGDYSVPYQTGPEIQILDDERHPDNAYLTHRAGSLYDMIAPSEVTVKNAGQWNTCILEINHSNNSGKVWLNGTLIVSFPVHGEEWNALIVNSKFKDWGGFGIYRTGRLGLQDHGNIVSFKNIKIIEL